MRRYEDFILKGNQEKKECCIVCISSPENIFGVGNVLIGLERHSKNLATNYILMCDVESITKSDIIALGKISEKILFYNIKEDDIFKKMKIQKKEYLKLTPYPYMVIAKLEMIDLLKYYKNIIYLDGDMLIQKDISNILKYKPLAWRPAHWKLKDIFFDKIDNLNETYTAPNGGLLYFSDTLPNVSSQELYELWKNYRNTKSQDEPVWGLMAFFHKIDVKILPNAYNPIWTKHPTDEAFIIHAAGKDKFWNNSIVYKLYPEWGENNNIWKALGGHDGVAFRDSPIGFPEDPSFCMKYFDNLERNKDLCTKIINQIPHIVIPSFDIWNDKVFFFLHKDRTCFLFTERRGQSVAIGGGIKKLNVSLGIMGLLNEEVQKSGFLIKENKEEIWIQKTVKKEHAVDIFINLAKKLDQLKKNDSML